MATYTKTTLSASNNGKQILVVGSGTATANVIHTAVASPSLDEVWLYGYSQSGATDITVLWGGTNYPDDYMTATVSIRGGRTLIVDGKLISNALVVSAFTSTGTVQVDGFVNRIAP